MLETVVHGTFVVFEKAGGAFHELLGGYQFPQKEAAQTAIENYMAANPTAEIYLGQVTLKFAADPDAE